MRVFSGNSIKKLKKKTLFRRIKPKKEARTKYLFAWTTKRHFAQTTIADSKSIVAAAVIAVDVAAAAALAASNADAEYTARLKCHCCQ